MTKIQKAIEYLENSKLTGREITDEDINDAANIFSSSYIEYMDIWSALKK